jgi:hypothetical protein
MAQCHSYGEFRSHGWIHLCFKAYLYCMVFHLWVQFHPCWIFFNVTWISSISRFCTCHCFIKLKKIIQTLISSLSFNIWYYPNFKLIEIHCFIIQPWYTIAHEFNICSLGQLHRANFLFSLYVFCAFHNCWGNSIWDKGVTTKHVWEPKTNMGFYMEEKYEDFQFIS